MRPSSDAIVADELHISAVLHGPTIIIDAADLGSAAHRLRAFWTNLISKADFVAAITAHRRPPIHLVDLLRPHHFPQLTRGTRLNPPPFFQGNVVGQLRIVMPTLVSAPDSYAFRPGREGNVVDESTQQCVPPSPEERERCMGYPPGFTAGLPDERSRTSALGQAFDFNTILTILEAGSASCRRAPGGALVLTAAAANMERIASVNRSLRRATSPQAPVVTSVSSASALLDGTLRLAAGADISWGRLPDPDPDISMPPAPGEPAPCTPFQINPLLPERLRGELRGLLEAWRHIAFAEDLSQLAELHATPFEIKLTTNTPVSVPARRMNPTSRAFVQQELAQMEQHGIIQRSVSPYGAPVVVVKQGDKMRLCIDYRQLNEVTIKQRHPMPLIGETLDAMVHANVFCVADMFKGFWQLPVAPADRAKTAFYGPDQLYEFNRMPFGLANAPAVFQSFSSRLVRDLPGTECFVDDIISGASEPSLPRGIGDMTAAEIDALDTSAWDIAAVMEQLLRLLQATVAAGARLNIKKCYFGFFKVDVLGFVLSDLGKSPQPQKVKAILDLPTPATVSDLRSFLGCCSFYREHMPHFATMAAPLTLLLHKDAKFALGQPQLEAVAALKAALTSAPCLRIPDFNKRFYLYTDWSQEGVGAVLMQRCGPDPTDGSPPAAVPAPSGFPGFYAVAYASRSNIPAERNLSAFDGELLAAVWALTKWNFYLSNSNFTWFTDHQALTWLQKSRQELPPKHARWQLRIAGYDFNTEHTPGCLNVVADHLSRSFPGGTGPAVSVEETSSRTDEAATLQIVAAAIALCNDHPHDPKVAAAAVCALSDAALHREAEIWQDAEVVAYLRDPPDLSRAVQPSRRVLERAAQYRWQPHQHTTAPPADTVPSSGKLLLHNAAQHFGGRLFRRSTQPDHSEKEVPPPAVRLELTTLIHEFWLHQGRTRTYFRLQPHFWWPGMFADVAASVAACKCCDMAKARSITPAGPLQPLPIMGLFFRFNVDLAGPLEESPRGNSYVMIVVEHLTGTVILSAIPRKTAANTAAAFSRQTLAVFGAPACVVTDQGNEWLGEFKQLLVAWEIDHRPGSRNHPQSNGKAERWVQIVKATLRACMTKHALASAPPLGGATGPLPKAFDWDDALPRIQLALNSSAQASTGMSAYFLLFGRQLLYPSELRRRFSEPLDSINDDITAATEAIARANLLRDHTLTAMGNQAAQQHRDTERFATVRSGQYIRRTTTFAPGQLVYLTCRPQHSTDSPVSDLVYVVVHVEGDIITMQGSDTRTIKDNASNLRRCHLPNISMAMDPSLRRTTALQPCERCLEYDSPVTNRMLVCDGCSTCWHCACCSPPLSSPPPGNWYCLYCVAVGRLPRQ
jgi:hypothetical protein